MTKYCTGTKNTASSVAAFIPPKTAVPSERREAALAPVATNSGTTPRMKAKDVIRIGRKRRRAACSAASRTDMCSFSRLSLANSTIRMAFLAAETDQRHDADLRVNVVRVIAQIDGQQRAE